MGRPMIIDSDVLRERVKIHLAMLNEIGIASRATIIACEYCSYCAEMPQGCPEDCYECGLHDECKCFGCGGRAENFEWRGVVEANAPEDIEVENFIKAIAKEVSE